MPDMPDYHQYLPNSNRFSLADLGELAARLGSIDTYDRRGEVIWYDNFSYGLGEWGSLLSGTGASLSLAAGTAFRSAYNAYLVCGSTSAWRAKMLAFMGTIELERAGLEICFTVGSAFDLIESIITYYTGTYVYTIEYELSQTDDEVRLRTTAGEFQKVATLSEVFSGASRSNFIKLVWDVTTDKYVRLLLNKHSISVSDIALQKVASTSISNTQITTGMQGNNGINSSMNINHVILTANEP